MCLLRGVSAPRGGSAPGGSAPGGGVSAPGGGGALVRELSAPGGYPSMH